MPDVKYAKRAEILRVVGEISLNFAQLESHIESMLSLVEVHLPAKSEVHSIKPWTGFRKKTEMLSKYASWYYERIEVHSLLDNKSISLEKFLKRCDELADERNKYVHAILHRWDPKEISQSFSGAPKPTFEFANGSRSKDSRSLEPVTSRHLKQMKVLAERIDGAAWEALSDFYSEMLVKSHEVLMKKRTSSPRPLSFGFRK